MPHYDGMKKYRVLGKNDDVWIGGVDSWREAVTLAKGNQPSSIWRGSWCITRFPWPGEGPKAVGGVTWTGIGEAPW